MKSSLSIPLLSILCLLSSCNGEVFDTFNMCYGDMDRGVFGLGRKKNNASSQRELSNKHATLLDPDSKLLCKADTKDKMKTVFGHDTIVHAMESTEKRVSHAVEVAEEALVQAVRDEVDLLFVDKDHPHDKSALQSVQNASNRRVTKRVIPASGKDKSIESSSSTHYPYGWGLD